MVSWNYCQSCRKMAVLWSFHIPCYYIYTYSCLSHLLLWLIQKLIFLVKIVSIEKLFIDTNGIYLIVCLKVVILLNLEILFLNKVRNYLPVSERFVFWQGLTIWFFGFRLKMQSCFISSNNSKESSHVKAQ